MLLLNGQSKKRIQLTGYITCRLGSTGGEHAPALMHTTYIMHGNYFSQKYAIMAERIEMPFAVWT